MRACQILQECGGRDHLELGHVQEHRSVGALAVERALVQKMTDSTSCPALHAAIIGGISSEGLTLQVSIVS